MGIFSTALVTIAALSVGTAAAPASPAPCDAVTAKLAADSSAAGYAMVGVQNVPAGEVAVFLKETHARVYVLTSSIEGARKLEKERGFKRLGECTNPQGVLQLLERDVEVDPATGDPV